MKQYKIQTLFLALALLGGALIHHAAGLAAETRMQAAAMQEQIQAFNQKAIAVNQEPYRPVTKKQSADVQQRLLLKVQQYGLSLHGVKNVRNDAYGVTYELDISGTWEGTAHLLEDFHVQDALIGITSLSMGVEHHAVHTVLRYKIYTKD